MNLRDFLEEYGAELMSLAVKRYRPMHVPWRETDAPERKHLRELKRHLKGKQQDAAIALARGFRSGRRGLILCGEMGTGKTIISLAVAHLIGARRTLVMCPPHLVRKWMREAEITLPRVKTVNINGPDLENLLALKCAPEPEIPEIYVLGRERAKLHYHTRTATARGLDDGTQMRPACPRCGLTFRDGLPRNERCPQCGEILRTPDLSRGPRRYAKAEFIKRYLRGVFDLFIADEVHELKGHHTAQGIAMGAIASACRHCLALTGTLMGGYASNLLAIFWRLFPEKMTGQGFSFHQPREFLNTYGTLERIIELDREGGRRRVFRVFERPGVSPTILTDFLLDRSVFISLEDVTDALPPFTEEIRWVEMDPEMAAIYHDLKSALTRRVRKALDERDRTAAGTYVHTLLGWPDEAFRGEDVGSVQVPALQRDLLPKEQELIDIVREEKRKGRRVLVYVEHSGTRDIIPRLLEVLQKHGFSAVALRAGTTSTENREAWIERTLKARDPDALICNVNLVKTGLDLVQFPTVVFYQTGYSAYTIRQASRRSWRITQQQPVRVHYLIYKDTLQEEALALVASKMEVALTLEGNLSDRGLVALAETSTSDVLELARRLVEDHRSDLQALWSRYRKLEALKAQFIGEDERASKAVRLVTRLRIAADGTAMLSRRHRVRLRDGKIILGDTIIGEYDLDTKQARIASKELVIVEKNGAICLAEPVPERNPTVQLSLFPGTDHSHRV